MISRKIQIIISITIIIGASFGLMILFMNMKKEPDQRPPKVAKLFVHAKPIKYETITPIINEGGRLGSQKKVDLISEVQGKILKGDILLKSGERFKKGDLIAKISDEEAKNNLMASKSRFLNILANTLPDIKIDYSQNYKNWLAFYNQINIKKDLPDMPKVKSETEKTFLASRNILNDFYTIKSAEVRLKKYEIRAPFDGSFVTVYFEIGSTINPGGKLGSIIQTNHLELEVPVKATDVQWLELGDNVTISVGNSKKKLTGRIVRIADFIQSKTQSVSVFVNIKPQTEVKLFEGMYLNASFAGKPINGVMELPRNAMFDDNMVYVINNNKLERSRINIHKVNKKTLLFSGLNEGINIITEPLINASDGILVEIIK